MRSKVGEDWYWNGEHIERPIPPNSPVSLAIAKNCRIRINFRAGKKKAFIPFESGWSIKEMETI